MMGRGNGTTFGENAKPTTSVVYEGESPGAPGLSSILVLEYDHLPPVSRRKRARKTFIGSLGTMSPEVLRRGLASEAEAPGYAFECDWFSIGVLAYTLATGQSPFIPICKNKNNGDIGGKDWLKKSTVVYESDALGGIRIYDRENFVLQGDEDNLTLDALGDQTIAFKSLASVKTSNEQNEEKKRQEYMDTLVEDKVDYNFFFLGERQRFASSAVNLDAISNATKYLKPDAQIRT